MGAGETLATQSQQETQQHSESWGHGSEEPLRRGTDRPDLLLQGAETGAP